MGKARLWAKPGILWNPLGPAIPRHGGGSLDAAVARFLWVVMGSAKLKAEARKTKREADEIYVSSASIWEIAIKSGLGKLNADPKLIVAAIGESGFMELPVYSRHAAMLSELPPHHRDPFDRLLLAQAMSEPLQLLTTDTTLVKYSELVRVIGAPLIIQISVIPAKAGIQNLLNCINFFTSGFRLSPE